MKVCRVLAVLLLVLFATGALYADDPPSAELVESGTVGTWQTNYAGSNSVFTWTPGCYVDCTATLAISFGGGAGGGAWFELLLPGEEDPLVTQTVFNGSQTTWLDWHVDILHGLISRTTDYPTVHKVEADSSNWQIAFLHNPGYTDGFGAKWVGGNTDVEPGKNLSIRFRWSPDGSGLPVTIHQYPTSTGEFIPEPSSLAALSSSLVCVGFAFYRRRRR